MEYTDIYNLPCLGDEDYSAVALYMQDLAQAIEENLFEQQTALELFLDRGSIAWLSLAGQVIAANLRHNIVSITVLEHVAGLTSGSVPTLPALRGWYYVSGNVQLAATGAITAQSKRQLDIWVTTLGYGAAGSETVAQFGRYVRTNGLVGGDGLWASGTVYHDGTTTLSVDMTILHGNVASTLTTTLNPPPRINIVYLGDTPDIRQVD